MTVEVADILEYLTGHFGEDFHSYARPMAEKRVRERAAQLSFPGLAEYRQFLKGDADEPGLMARMLRVRFSCFFRDPLQFELLGTIVLPALLSDCRGQFRAWSAGCACGEEPYSLAILLDEAMQMHDPSTRVQIFATDICEEALEVARQGRYRAESVAGVTLGRLDRHFDRQKSEYRVDGALRKMVTFSRYDLLDQRTYVPPESLFGGFQLVLCRNFLMYLGEEAYSRVFDKLFRSLNPGGVLMLGKAETVPPRYAPYLERAADFGNIYRKRG